MRSVQSAYCSSVINDDIVISTVSEGISAGNDVYCHNKTHDHSIIVKMTFIHIVSEKTGCGKQ